MASDAKPSTFIATIEVSGTDAEVLDQLERAGLTVDREYGLIRMDAAGRRRVARVRATAAQLERAQVELPVTFFPDLGVTNR